MVVIQVECAQLVDYDKPDNSGAEPTREVLQGGAYGSLGFPRLSTEYRCAGLLWSASQGRGWQSLKVSDIGYLVAESM